MAREIVSSRPIRDVEGKFVGTRLIREYPDGSTKEEIYPAPAEHIMLYNSQLGVRDKVN